MEQDYAGYGPTLAQEKLQERHGIKVSVESLRQWMIGDGQWKAKRGQNIIVHPLRKRRRQRQRQRHARGESANSLAL